MDKEYYFTWESMAAIDCMTMKTLCVQTFNLREKLFDVCRQTSFDKLISQMQHYWCMLNEFLGINITYGTEGTNCLAS